RRSAKKPTAVSAATARVTAITSRRSSPARQSRSRDVQPMRQKDGAWGFMGGYPNANRITKLSSGRKHGGIPASNRECHGSGSAGPSAWPPGGRREAPQGDLFRAEDAVA